MKLIINSLKAIIVFIFLITATGNTVAQNFEKQIDGLRWEILDEMVLLSHFQLETVLSFYIKYTIVERWQKLDPVFGKQKLTQLINDLGSGLKLSEQL